MMHVVPSLLLFWGSIAVGYAARRARWLPPDFAPRCLRCIATWIAPPTALLSMWVLDFTHLTLLSLPFLGLAVSMASLLPAWWLARRWALSGPRRGSWLLSALFSNVGYLGALIAFALWGEQAYGLCTMYFLFFGTIVYTLGYTIGGRYGAASSTVAPLATNSWEWWHWTPMVGTLIGLSLSFGGVARPLVLGPFNRALIPLLTGAYLFTVGTTMRCSRVGAYWREGLWMSAIKLLYAPLIGTTLAWLFGYQHLLNGLVFRVAVLESAMPTAITSLTLPALFRLDQDFANSLWIITTLASMLVIPLLLWRL